MSHTLQEIKDVMDTYCLENNVEMSSNSVDAMVNVVSAWETLLSRLQYEDDCMNNTKFMAVASYCLDRLKI